MVTVALALCIAFPSASGASEARRVAILPFQVYSETDVSFLRERMYESMKAEMLQHTYVSLIERDVIREKIGDRPLMDHEIMAAGRELEADYVVTGSLTRIGNLISADVRVVDVAQGLAIRDLYAQGEGLESIESIAKELVQDILFKLFAGQRIAEVRFEGNERIEDAALYNAIRSTKGVLFSRHILSEDIKALYKMGHFSDVKAEVTDSSDGRIITFILKERPRIVEINFRGNKKIKERDLRDVLTIKPREIYDPDKVNNNVEIIRRYYEERGYLNVEVSFVADESKDGMDVYITFNIDEHRKPSIRSISFEGNMVYTDEELKKMMEISEWGIFHFFTDAGLFNRAELQRDVERLTVFYHNNGFIDAQIGEPEITIDDRWIYISIPVYEGRQYQVGSVAITGDTLETPVEKLKEGLEITKRDHFDREAIIKDLEYLTGACNNEGYAYANVIPETVVHKDKQTIDVIYRIEKGHKVYIDNIIISGNTRTRDKVIRRQLAIVEGQLYNRDKLTASYERLNALDYFEEVNFQTEKGAEEDLMDVIVQVSEKRTGLFSVGAGYSAQENAVFLAQIAERNLFGRGQTLALSGWLGSSSNEYELSFIEPWLFDIPLWSKAEVWKMELERDFYDVDTMGFAGTLGYRLFEYVDGYVRYRFAENEVLNISPYASWWIREQEGSRSSSGLTFTLVRDTKRPYMFPSRGSRHSVSIEYTGGVLQGDDSFIRWQGSTRWYFPLPMKHVFSVKAEIGCIHPQEGEEVPVYERYILGGINTLRGLRDVGPRHPDYPDEVRGGKTMMIYTAEWLIPLMEDAGIRGVVFFDTGNSWESGFHFGDMRRTAGAGIRWNSPIGPFRLEWGHVLDRKENESASRWEFTVGTAF